MSPMLDPWVIEPGSSIERIAARELKRGDCFELGGVETVVVHGVEPATDGRVSITGGIDASTRAPDAAALLLPGGMELDVVRGAA